MRSILILMAVMVLGACSAATPDAGPVNGGPDGGDWRVVGLGEACGGMAGVRCEGADAGANYCAYAPTAQCGAADQMGVCTARPQMCTREYRPVCGCDGEIYGNACTAAAAGASVVHEGECRPAR